MFAVEPGLLGPKLQSLGRALHEKVTAILVVSAHWQTLDVRVMATEEPETIYDFGGFPEELYRLTYPVAGSKMHAEKASRLLEEAGFPNVIDTTRGLDHGAWVPLRHLLPKPEVPVFQVSMPVDLKAPDALRLGAALAPLREQGVLIVGSGSLTHNLFEVFRGAPDAKYAQTFVNWVRGALERRDFAQLADYRRQAPDARRAHPTEEHFLPLLVASGASAPADSFSVLEGGMTYEVLSMDSFLWGGK